MRLLIVSFKAGEGHNSAANAIRERAVAEGHEVEVIDFLSLFSHKISSFINGSYITMIKHAPFLFGAYYSLSLKFGRLRSSKVHSALYQQSIIVSKPLRKYMEKHGPYDAVIATHIMSTLAQAHLKKHGFKLPLSVFVATDYTYYPFTEETVACDYYVIGNEKLIPLYTEKGIDEKKLKPLGIPIRMRFLKLPGKAEAREKLGLEAEKPYFLMMGGSMGLGKIKDFVRDFQEKPGDSHMIVICGSNEKLKNQLEKITEGNSRMHILGYTEDIPLYMSACDVLFTKPGGLTTSEALACGIPIVYGSPIPGCENDNLRFFTENGCALPSQTVEDQLLRGLELMNDPARREEMSRTQKQFAKPDAAKSILELVRQESEKKKAAGDERRTEE